MKREAEARVWKENGLWWAVAPGFPPIGTASWRTAMAVACFQLRHSARRAPWWRRWLGRWSR